MGNLKREAFNKALQLKGEKMSRRNRRKKSKAKVLIVVLLIIALLIIVMAVGGAMAWKHVLAHKRIVSKPKAVLEKELPVIASKDSPYYDTYKKSKKVNVLILGINQGLSDTIMLASYDEKKDKVDLISIPRDTEYHRDGFDSVAEQKINSAYRKNPLNTAKAVSDILMGMPINYYAVVDYKAIEKIVDDMDGVPINVPKAMHYTDPYDKPPLVINIPAGEQVLDGKTAVKYLRFRKGYADGDIGRVKAQQEFMKAALDRAIGTKLPKVIKTAVKNLDTDMTLGTAVTLAIKAKDMAKGEMTTYLLPGIPPTKAPWYWTPDEEGIKDMIETIYGLKKESKESKNQEDNIGEKQSESKTN